jgi:hypothetical protein
MSGPNYPLPDDLDTDDPKFPDIPLKDLETRDKTDSGDSEIFDDSEPEV